MLGLKLAGLCVSVLFVGVFIAFAEYGNGLGRGMDRVLLCGWNKIMKKWTFSPCGELAGI